MNGNFFALMFRMKYINRWGLMRSSRQENLSEHSLECMVLAHALAMIGNKKFNKKYDINKIALKAAYHDSPEIITGDMPTPIKYFSKSMRQSYEVVEADAINKLLFLLPEEYEEEYKQLYIYTQEEKIIIKAADKLCAYIKCLDEINSGNNEFKSALKSTEE
ncbi:5'-deoxynucleotidase, partial [Eubacteriales bacterium OttesenSCG-928-G02]|nr:5'-deoxynucleotidase [Eubacteriales bacterium OttesenSCG-928-G02]